MRAKHRGIWSYLYQLRMARIAKYILSCSNWNISFPPTHISASVSFRTRTWALLHVCGRPTTWPRQTDLAVWYMYGFADLESDPLALIFEMSVSNVRFLSETLAVTDFSWIFVYFCYKPLDFLWYHHEWNRYETSVLFPMFGRTVQGTQYSNGFWA